MYFGENNGILSETKKVTENNGNLSETKNVF